MNNLETLRDFFQLGLTTVSSDLNISATDLKAYESGEKMPAIPMWQHFAEYYANHFHVPALPDNQEPIHFRLIVDYLMNIGLTLNDLLAIKWYFDNTRPELGDFSLTLYQPGAPIIERRTVELTDILDEFAGYLLLNHDGTLNQFIDERHDNKISDWRLILYNDDYKIIDITADLIYFDHLVNYTVI